MSAIRTSLPARPAIEPDPDAPERPHRVKLHPGLVAFLVLAALFGGFLVVVKERPLPICVYPPRTAPAGAPAEQLRW